MPAPSVPEEDRSRKPGGKPASGVFRRLLFMLRPHAAMIGLALLLLVVSSPCELFPAIVWKFVTDDVVLQIPSSPWIHKWFSLGGAVTSRFGLLGSALVWLFVVYLAGEVMGTLDTWILSRVAQKFVLVFRNRVYHKLQSQSLGYFQRQRTGDLMSRAMNDVDELQGFIVSSIDVIVSEGLLWLVTVGLVMYMDWRVASISLAPLFIVFFLLRVFNRKVKPIYSAARDRLGDISTRLQENLSGVVVIKIFGRERQEAERFEQTTQAYYRTQIRAINARNIFFPLTRVVGFFSNIFMVGVGGFFMLQGAMLHGGAIQPGGFTPGKLVAFRAYWWRLFGPIQTLARVNDMVQRAAAAGRRVFEVLDAPDELPDAPTAQPLAAVRGQMELRDVSFSYGLELAPANRPPAFEVVVPSNGNGSPAASPVTATSLGASSSGDSSSGDSSSGDSSSGDSSSGASSTGAVVLHGVNIRIEPGQTVALCGPSGSGKSTVLNLLLRFYDPLEGQVLLDARPLPDITKASLRSHFALVQQETFLFNDSILDNIRYGHGEATLEQVVAAAKAANAHEFITRLPNGYDTRVGERGVRLSGGQKQRISIARAFLANPTVLLLDEPTSSVEPDSEAAIIAALRRLMAGRTTVLTSHRPSLICQADRVYVLEDGRVTARGAPAELMEQEGWFSRFMRSAEEAMPRMEAGRGLAPARE